MIVKGKSVDVLKSIMHGNSHVLVEVQPYKMVNGYKTYIGPVLEGTGGFIKAKEFNYPIAERAALEVAISKSA